MFRFLRVNMSAGTCVFEDIPQEYAGLGWRALTSTIVAREVEPTCSLLDPHNSVCARSAGRHQQHFRGGASPLTGGIKESNAGAQPGGHLARLGIPAIIVAGMTREGALWQQEESHNAARGGVDAVMGSKGLKAIVVNPEGGKNYPLVYEAAFRDASKRFAKALAGHPITGKALPNTAPPCW